MCASSVFSPALYCSLVLSSPRSLCAEKQALKLGTRTVLWRMGHVVIVDAHASQAVDWTFQGRYAMDGLND